MYLHDQGQDLLAVNPSYFFLDFRPVTMVELLGKADTPLNNVSLSEKSIRI